MLCWKFFKIVLQTAKSQVINYISPYIFIFIKFIELKSKDRERERGRERERERERERNGEKNIDPELYIM